MAPAPKYSTEKQLELILTAAAQCISDSSVTDFTMAKVSRLAGLSMGSVYKFVQSKEDILLALACESFAHFSSLFKKALQLPVQTPEKILAVCLIAPKKMQCFEFDYELQSYATNEAVIRRASPMWTDKLITASSCCQELFHTTIADSIKTGDLKPIDNLEEVVEEILISGWAMTTGYEQILRINQTQQIVEGTESLFEPLALNDPIIRSLVRLLNTYPWLNPITDESLQRIEAELIKLGLR